MDCAARYTRDMTNTEKLQEQLHYYTRTGNHEAAAIARRNLKRESGESWIEHYNRRWHEQQAIPADELI